MNLFFGAASCTETAAGTLFAVDLDSTDGTADRLIQTAPQTQVTIRTAGRIEQRHQRLRLHILKRKQRIEKMQQTEKMYM